MIYTKNLLLDSLGKYTYDDDIRDRQFQLLDDHKSVDKAVVEFDHNRLQVYYQPIICYASGSVVGLEALLRYADPEKGILFPDDFLPQFLAHEPSINLVEWLLHKIHEHSSYFSKCKTDIPISINITASDLQDDKLVTLIENFKKINQETRLSLELTESNSVASIHKALSIVEALHKLDVNVYLDDFGTGFANYDLLDLLPFDTVKIDKSLIYKMFNSAEDANVVKSIIKLLQLNKMKIIAEGVNSIDEANYLMSMGCCFLQGYGIHKAMTYQVIPLWVKKCILEEVWWTTKPLDDYQMIYEVNEKV